MIIIFIIITTWDLRSIHGEHHGQQETILVVFAKESLGQLKL
jgi:hypothetical protein